MKFFYGAFIVLCLMSFVKTDTTKTLDKLVDDWHLAATKAMFDPYFGVMSDDFVFLGTAPGERWKKGEFASFCKPYFDNGKAWDFKASNRQWSFSKNGKTAWFDEDLTTWMRGCRGSGVLTKEKGEWKISYYNLTVLIENEKIQEFIDLRDKEIVEDSKTKN
ncbi:MAG: nuclear transport factor 2 family protein [Crocinitomicaceae bacterium]|nr:nuclear transport factor 2 family protein [Crocinitomicaceae bacterium]